MARRPPGPHAFRRSTTGLVVEFEDGLLGDLRTVVNPEKLESPLRQLSHS